MSKLRLVAFQSVAIMIGLGVLLAFILAATAAKGGRLTLDMTHYGEMWPEYWVMFVSVGILPWGLWYLTEKEVVV